MTYTGRNETNNTLTGITRTASLVNFQAGAQRTYTGNSTAGTHANRTGVVLISNTCTPLISHWGSAFITDGMFDEDRGYIFSYTEPNIEITGIKKTAFLIRLAPSVSNAIIGDLGERELLNRAQLLLQGLEVTSEANATGSIVIEGVLNPKNYPTNPNNITWVGLASEAQGGQPSFAQVASGGSVTWTDNTASTTATITAQGVMTGTAITNDRFYNGDFFMYMRYDGGSGTSDIGLQAGDTLTATSGPSTVPAGTTVTFISSPYFYDGNLEVSVNISAPFSGNGNVGETLTFTRGGTLTSSNYMLATQNSFESSSAAIGTSVTATSAGTIPANTIIQNVEQKTFAGTTYYRVSFNNAYSGTLTAGSGTIEVTFVAPVYAQPGENILSFIANPGEKSEIDLGELKELTNTTLGGRGTFPNGPDVLAINVYKTTGTAVNGSMILRWGEAQA